MDRGCIFPESVDASAINKWLFQCRTVDKVLEHLMTHGIKLKKAIAWQDNHFSKNRDHAHS